MSEIEYILPNVVGKFRRIPVKYDGVRYGCYGCAVEDDTKYDCDGAPCTPDTILELIPGTDAPANLATPELALIVARDRIRVLEAETAEWLAQGKSASARIVDLEAKLAALESARPLAVLPHFTEQELVEFCYDRPRVRSLLETAVAVQNAILSRIQPVDPEYLAAMEEYYNAPNWPAQDTCRKKVEAIRARLAAGKGGV